MKTLTLALITERKVPADHRVALLPEHCRQILQQYPGTQILVEPSAVRAIPDAAYAQAGCTVTADISPAQVLFGIKEVPASYLQDSKTYFMFSHTIKKQAHNQALFAAMAEKQVTLIDYECLVDERNQRTVAFGYFAGVVGAYNGLRGYGLKHGLFSLPPATQCHDREGMRVQLQGLPLSAIKVVVTGRGRVANGAIEVLQMAGLTQVEPAAFLSQTFDKPVFTVLGSAHYNRHREGKAFDQAEFYTHPEFFEGSFQPYAQVAQLLVACAYWHPKAPRLFSEADLSRPDFSLDFIADITCDINGSIPTTVRASTIAQPFYDIDRSTLAEQPAFSAAGNLTVMAVDNLPCELPEDASRHFGQMLLDHVLPRLMGQDDGMLSRATILQRGHLTERYKYLSDYLEQGVAV